MAAFRWAQDETVVLRFYLRLFGRDLTPFPSVFFKSLRFCFFEGDPSRSVMFFGGLPRWSRYWVSCDRWCIVSAKCLAYGDEYEATQTSKPCPRQPRAGDVRMYSRGGAVSIKSLLTPVVFDEVLGICEGRAA